MLENASSILGLRVWRFTLLGGMMPFSNANTVLMTPATPLPPSKCPMFDLTEPLNLTLGRSILHLEVALTCTGGRWLNDAPGK